MTNREDCCTQCGLDVHRMTWQPIATAPKDGTEVLVTDGTTYAVASWYDAGGEWRDVGDIGWGGMEGALPTHWMALPALPGK